MAAIRLGRGASPDQIHRIACLHGQVPKERLDAAVMAERSQIQHPPPPADRQRYRRRDDRD
ncbi:gp54 [Alphaproteobacteria phage PhiJL001]|uniref:Gp54 n=1 Tax=Alphaproteobacteria phage PhiJL001 TaxID=2681607 RepID=Q5DN51_9CAUD|nr:gp54 [Alphaproteobacteria phage PhiJL001]AAT69530.1 gp54 [Alphaproteobacteria phage PhiJL001]